MSNLPSSSATQIQPLATSDLDGALDLCRANGWNQLRSDWQRLLDHEPNGCFAATIAGRLVGTVTTTSYDRQLAWIGMMLVHPDFRRRGIATALLQESISYLRGRGVRCIKLDATPVGQHVYRQLGFEVEWSFHRWQGRGQAGQPAPILPPTKPDLPDELLELDAEAFGADRRVLLALLQKDSLVYSESNALGMLRPGALATYLGPVISRTPEAAERIIRQLCETTAGTIFWDVPTPHARAVQLAQAMHFQPVRELTRMRLGSEVRPPQGNLQYALAGPATG